MRKSKTIVWGVSGGIAIYKVIDIISNLKKLGHQIHVVMTQNATQFIKPLTFQAISQNPVLTDTFHEATGCRHPAEDRTSESWEAMSHIKLADNCDIFIIAPATYNVIGKIANGIADDLLTTIASAITCRKIIAPAMNSHMYENHILQKNLNTLKENDYEIIQPDRGMLACGYEGMGRLRRVEDILEELTRSNEDSILLTGKKILVTAGGTQEKIDPVRYIGNFSSGKMGIRFAEACRDLGADVTLVYSQIKTNLPKDIRLLHAENAANLLSVLEKEITNIDLLVMAAAVSDFRVTKVSSDKIKKQNQPITLSLTETPDILKTLGKKKKKDQLFVGFAAESNNLINNAKAKLKDKNLDMIIANDISKDGIGFDADENEVTLLFSEGEKLEFPLMSKYDLSVEILKVIHNHFFT